MPKQYLDKLNLSSRIIPIKAESLVRNVLLVGFVFLLILIGGLGFWSQHALLTVEEDISEFHQVEANHRILVLETNEIIRLIMTEAREPLAKGDKSLLGGVQNRRLKDLKRDLDSQFESASKSSLSETQEWKDLLASFSEYWDGVSGDRSDIWVNARLGLIQAMKNLETLVSTERQLNDERSELLSHNARKKIRLATIAILIVGGVIAALTFYEIRRTLNNLGVAYKQSSEARDYLQSLFDSLISGVVVVGQDGRIEVVSASFRSVPGIDSADLVGQSYTRLFKEKNSWNEQIAADLEEKPQFSRYLGRAVIGGLLFDVSSSPLMISEESRGLILVFVDITSAEQAQEELRRNRALTAVGQMTAQIAHEVKNPLGSIKFATEVLKRKISLNGNEIGETIEVIERSVNHLTEIVSELSEFARPKQMHRSEVNVNRLLEDMMPMLADRLNAKGIVIEKEFRPDIQDGLYDATELRKLFLNLIINAIDASNEGSKIEVKTMSEEGNSIRVDVIDHGTGMDPETLRRLFEPFYTTKQKGTGLGMAISKKIAEMHRGDLVIKSNPGEGTTVQVRLPIDL